MAQQQQEVSARDEALPFFSVEEADHFRELVKKDVAQYGKALTFHPDHIASDDGGIYAYWNVAQDCRHSARRQWPKIIASHFVHITKIDPKGDLFKGMSQTQVEHRLFLKIWPDVQLGNSHWYPYARKLAPGLQEVIAFHKNQATMAMRQQDVERFGGAEHLRQIAEGNLRALALGRRDRREMLEGPSGGNFRVLSGPSNFTASRLLVVDRLVSHLFVEPELPYGVLAAIPTRNEVGVHVIRDASAVASLLGLATFAAGGVNARPGPISPHVYWVTPDGFEEVLHVGHGEPKLTGSPGFTTMMDEILLADDAVGTRSPGLRSTPQPASWGVGCGQTRLARRGH